MAAAACTERGKLFTMGGAQQQPPPPPKLPEGNPGAGMASRAPTARAVAAALPELLNEAAGTDMAWEVLKSANSSLLP